MKILIIVLSYKDNNVYSKFYESQKNTWDSINVEGVETYYLFGNHHCDEIIDKEILVNVSEGNLSICGHKTLKSFILTKNIDFDYIFRTNSSSYIDKQMLVDYIKDKPKEKYYSGVIGEYYNGIKFSSGSGYFISKDLVDLVIENIHKWDHDYIDDVAIADVLRNFDIYPSANSRYDVYPNNEIPLEYFHYRLKTDDRYYDINNMYLIKKIKDEFYNGKQI